MTYTGATRSILYKLTDSTCISRLYKLRCLNRGKKHNMCNGYIDYLSATNRLRYSLLEIVKLENLGTGGLRYFSTGDI